MSTVIRVENLSKSYRIGAAQHGNYTTLRDAVIGNLKNTARNLFSAFRKPSTEAQKLEEARTLWALKDINFEVKKGEMIGVIGRNGAGKSTLLKVLSRITQPTEGRALISGRMASLLEVGTGFHPELTGRENVFLNGSILGMSRSEIRAKFDQIVAYSGIERFIDTPVKHYSSGMYVRLAFAVAAHLDPDILVVDEVLSVGDVAFQRKCTDTMKDVTSGNRTVLFVTHNLTLVRSLCTRAILVEAGKITADGPTDQVLNTYIRSLQKPRDLSAESVRDRNARTSGAARFTTLTAVDKSGMEKWFYEVGEELKFRFQFNVHEPIPSLGVYVSIRSALSSDIVTTVMETLSEGPMKSGADGSYEIRFPAITLRPGDYTLYFALGEKKGGNWYDVIDENVNIPILSVTSEERDFLKRLGFFSMPAEIKPFAGKRHAAAG